MTKWECMQTADGQYNLSYPSYDLQAHCVCGFVPHQDALALQNARLGEKGTASRIDLCLGQPVLLNSSKSIHE